VLLQLNHLRPQPPTSKSYLGCISAAAAPNGTVYFCDITNPKPQEIGHLYQFELKTSLNLPLA